MHQISILYDGDCLLCSRFQKYAELRKKHRLTRYDISTHPDHVEQYRRLGYDANAGMIIDIDGTIYHGAMALTVLNTLLVSHHWRDKIVLSVVKNKQSAKIVYPILLLMRRIIIR